MELPEIDIFLQIFLAVEAQGANGRFRAGRDGAMTEIGRKADSTNS
jgi:hypothetical protein